MHKSLRAAATVVVAGTFVVLSQSEAQTISPNSGTLGSAGDGVNTPGVVLGLPGAVSAGGDVAAGYGGGTTTSPVNTVVQYNATLNPASGNPFSIEFWAKPTLDIIDGSGPAPVFNRVSTGNRSGWVFFQRAANQGWNFAMYNGSGSTVGLQVTGGTYTPGSWSHVVAVWTGSTPLLYVNGLNTNAPVVVTGGGGYNASTAALFSIGSYDTGANSFTGSVDETAFYGAALTPAQIAAHYAAATSAVPGAYSALIAQDNAIEYLRNIPEPSAVLLLACGLVGCVSNRRRRVAN